LRSTTDSRTRRNSPLHERHVDPLKCKVTESPDAVDASADDENLGPGPLTQTVHCGAMPRGGLMAR
jgi:hypothetical protein